MKVFILIVGLTLFLIQNSSAQAGYTAVPFIEPVLDVRMQSLGNSFVSFFGYRGASEVNPAGIGNQRELSANFSKREWKLPFNDDPYTLYQFGLNSGVGRWGIAYQSRYIDYSQDSFNSGEEIEYYHNLSTSYTNQKGLRVGLGLNYIYSDLGRSLFTTDETNNKANAFSVDFGFQYQKQIQSEKEWKFTPSFGLSISDFGSLVKYSGQEEADPLPMRFRSGVGLTTDFDRDWNGFQLLRSNLAFGVSKFLIAIERDENGNFQRFGPFETIVKAWKPFEAIDPNTGNSTEYSLGEQLILHSGLELTFLETFSFRLGYQNGQELNSFYSIRSIGFGIDLYYIALDYVSSVQYDEDYDEIDTPLNGAFLQVTGRIPFNGKSPKSLLGLLFNN